MSETKVTPEQIEAIISASKIEVTTIGEKTTLVHAVLPNGFVIVESSSCVDPENYNEELGKSLCIGRIKNKIWELEGYRLQCSINS